MIAFDKVSKSFNGLKVLDRVSFEIEDGEVFVILGRSGVGKSVTLKHIVGLLQPDSGVVKINGKVLDPETRTSRSSRRDFGYLFQSGALLNSLNVFENVALPLREHEKMKRSKQQERVAERLGWVELKGVEEKMPSELSLGMKKRVALARALVRDPKVVLYDEPTSGLDPMTAKTIDNLILHLNKKLSVTSVVVTHDLQSAFEIADRIAILHEGKIVACGTPEEIRDDPDPHVQAFIHARNGIQTAASERGSDETG